MSDQKVSEMPTWKKLTRLAEEMNRPEKHLKFMLEERKRLETFSLKGGGLFYDFSRQRLDPAALDLLWELADKRDLPLKFKAMVNGEKVNKSENRAALHTALRNFSGRPVRVDDKDVMPEIIAVRDTIKVFAEKVRSEKIVSSSGKPFKHAVVIGIGGSYLGTEFAARALAAFADEKISLHFLSNVDIHDFGRVASRIEPQSTLWIVISKSYTTAETTANTQQAYAFMREQGLDPALHTVTVTSKGSPGDDPSNPVLDSFHMFDFIGGRYSVTSAVGGVPLSLYLGYDVFERFLRGAEEMDRHAVNAPLRKNLPLTAALISIWNNNFLGYATQAVIPYASPLSKLAPHIQQLNMESNGKSVSQAGEALDIPTGVIIFGEPGTNAQHSFFQLAHQGRPFPIDFIGVLTPQYGQYRSLSGGVSNFQELWANLISQPRALALGKEDPDPARSFSGNRPSSTILLPDLNPENVGRLLAFYEARTVFEAFIWGSNPFDQFGVELGKTLADEIRRHMAARNQDSRHDFKGADPISRFYLERFYEGKL